jgi:CBS domain containing-hemolysin-like protein
MFGLDPNADEETVTEEEIRMMVDVGQEKGVIEDSQKEMINNEALFVVSLQSKDKNKKTL